MTFCWYQRMAVRASIMHTGDPEGNLFGDFLLLRACIVLVSNSPVQTVRLFFLLVLSWAIPLAGYAGLGVPQMPCPMEMAGMAAQQFGTRMDSIAAAKMGDCCNDMETLLKTGKTCKAGQDCKIGSLGLSVQLFTLPQSFPVDSFLARIDDRAIEPRTVPIWRPPA